MVEFIALVFMVFVVVYLFILFKKPKKQTHVPITQQLPVPLPPPLPEEASEIAHVPHPVKDFQPQAHKQPQQAIYLREGFDDGASVDFTSPLNNTTQAWISGQVASQPVSLTQPSQQPEITTVPIGPTPQFTDPEQVRPTPQFTDQDPIGPTPSFTTVEMIPFSEQFQKTPTAHNQEEGTSEELPPCAPVQDSTYGCVIGTCVKDMGIDTLQKCQETCKKPAPNPSPSPPEPEPCHDGTKPCTPRSPKEPCGPLPRPMIPCSEEGNNPDNGQGWGCVNKKCRQAPKNLPSHFRYRYPYKNQSDCLKNCESCHASHMCNPNWGSVKDGVPCGPLPVRQTYCPEEEFHPKDNYGCFNGKCIPHSGKLTHAQCKATCFKPPPKPSPSPTPSCIIPGVPTPGSGQPGEEG